MTGIFFTQDGEMHPLGEIGEIYFSPDETAAFTESVKIITANSGRASIEFNVPRRQMERILLEVHGITRMVIDIVRDNGHGRIAHLAKHGRKARTRKKNRSRAFRLLARNAYL